MGGAGTEISFATKNVLIESRVRSYRGSKGGRGVEIAYGGFDAIGRELTGDAEVASRGRRN